MASRGFNGAYKKDLAFRNYGKPGLVGYTAMALVLAWCWALVAGILMLIYGQQVALSPAGPVYDAVLHSIFVGFVFSMIFGHGPIIFPSVLQLSIPYRGILYVPLVLLQVFVILRLWGDVMGVWQLRQWASLGTAAIIPLFMLSMLGLIIWGWSKKAVVSD